MRTAALSVLACVAAALPALAQDVPPDGRMAMPPMSPPPRLTMESTLPADAASAMASPVLQSITIMDVVPDFHFMAPRGNAIVLRRELVDTSGAFSQTQIASATINIPAEAQKKGAAISGGWRCGVSQYYITLRAFVMDADGNRSNALRYTIHCNGG
jgi:hypothetical protein